MRFRCLVFDHDDTVVNSTATIHYPCFVRFLEDYYPQKTCSLDEFFLKNFSPGFLSMCREEYGMDEETIELEGKYWNNYVRTRIPAVYPGIRDIMLRHRAEGGLIAVISHSYRENILRDYLANGLPEPDLVFGWELPPEKRKPSPWPLREVMHQFSLHSDELLVIDDLKPGLDMANACAVPFAASGWANDIPEIEQFMRSSCRFYFKQVSALAEFLFS